MDDAARRRRLFELFDEAVLLAGEARAELVARAQDEDPEIADRLVRLLAADASQKETMDERGPSAPAAPQAENARRRLVELFNEACDLGDRSAAVDALFERVRKEDAGIADRLAGALAADKASRFPDSAAPPPLVETIGGFRIVKLLGKGAMGMVYEGAQELPSRRVAVKVIDARHPGMIRRFELEAEMLARLHHSGIAAIYQAGVDGGRPYIAMELVDGRRLDEAAELLDVRAKLGLVALICDAVHHAHQKGIIHRDLKPANILVTAEGVPKVLDFGVARLLEIPAEERATMTGMLVGTPAYMSPEQAATADADSRADVYSLALIAYELVSGRLPYPKWKSLDELLTSVREAPALPISQFVPALAGDLEVILEKALAKEPDARYPSAAALADDLRHYLADEDISARRPGIGTQIARFARKNRALTATAGGLVVAIVAAAVLTGVLFIQAERGNRALESRNQALVLSRARAELEVDPTTAVRTLATLPPGLPGVADLGRLAVDRGVARAVLAGHESEVRGAVFSPDGASVASVGYDHTIRIWDLRGRTARVLRGHTARVNFAFYTAGRAILSGGEDGVRLWGDGKLLDPGAAEDGAVAPDGKTLAATSGNGVTLWAEDGAQRGVLAGPTAATTRVVWSPAGRSVAAGCTDGSVWVWAAGGGAGKRLGGHGSEVTELAFADETSVLAAGRDDVVRRYDAAGPAAAPGGPGGGEAIEVGRDLRAVTCGGGVCVWADKDGQLTIWQGGALRHVRGSDGVVRWTAFSPDGQSFATGGDDRTVRLYDLASGAAAVLRGHRARVRMVAFAPDGKLLASAANDGTVRLWAADGPELHLAHDGAILGLAFAPDPRAATVASGGADSRVRIVSLGGGRARTLPGPSEGTTSLALGADGRVVAAGRGRSVLVYPAGADQPSLLDAPDRVVHLELAGAHLAAATLGGPIPIWDLDAGTAATLDGHVQRVNDVRFLPDGRLVSGGDDKTVRVWDLATRVGTVLGSLDDHVTVLAVAGDGRIAAASAGGAIRVLRVGSGGTAGPEGPPLVGHEGRVLALAFSPAGRLASGGHDGSVRVWDLGTGAGTVVTHHDAPVTSLVWAGDTLVSASEDQVAAAWDGRESRVLGSARRLAASPDGKLVAGGGDDGLAHFWRVDEAPLDLPALTTTIDSR